MKHSFSSPLVPFCTWVSRFTCRLCLPVWLLSGCTGFKTQDATLTQKDPGHAATGLHYFLPKARIKIVGTEAADAQHTYTIAISRDLVADKEKRFRLIQTESAFHQDTMKYAVDRSGLINSDLTATSESKVEDVVLNVVNTALNVVQMKIKGASPAKTGSDVAPAEAAPVPLKPFEVNFDPYVRKEVLAAAAIMKDAGFTLKSEELFRHDKRPAQHPYRSLETGEVTSSQEGIYYRPSTTVRIKVDMARGDQNLLVNENMSIPDKDDLAVFHIARGLFAKTEHTVTFANGEITKMVLDKKSEGVGLTSIPLKATKAVLDVTKAVPAVANFFWKPKADPNADIKGQTARLQAEKARLEEENTMMKLAQENEQLRKGLPATPSSTSGSTSSADSRMRSDAGPPNTAPETDEQAAERRKKEEAARQAVQELQITADQLKKRVEQLEAKNTGN